MKLKFNFFAGVTASSLLLTLMVIVAELYAPFKDILKAVFGHHWIGKVVIMAIVFFAVSYLYRDKKFSEKNAWYSAIISVSVILLFYIVNYMVSA